MTPDSGRFPRALRDPPFALLLALAWGAVAAHLLLLQWAQTGQTLLDTDDAMRLLQMREWLNGRGWFDLHEPRLQPPLGYDSHWSRLVDAGLAGLLLLLRLFVDAALAERLMRAVWPLLWLFPTIVGMTAIAWRIAGREAALVALLLAALGVPAYQQFTPGRIDHHNVQIALAVLAAAATAWSDRRRWCAPIAGAVSGLALGIGFESLPYLLACSAAFALRYLGDPQAGPALRGYTAALAAATLAVFLGTVGPQHWMRPVCDALAVNTLVAIAAGAVAALALVGRMDARIGRRAMVLIAVGGAALAAFCLIEPRCLRGPYAMVDPAIWPIWLADVREAQPLAAVFRINPLTGAGIAAFPAVAVIATLALARDGVLRRDFGYLAAAAVFIAAAVTTVAAIRAYSYAIWLGMPLVAALAPRLFALLRLHTLPARFVAGLLLTPMALSSGAITIANAAGLEDGDSFARPESAQCFRTANYAQLAALPKGLVVGDVSLGPFILALTDHAVLSAPYHRLGIGILAAHRVLASGPDAAYAVLHSMARDPSRPTYVVVCGGRPPAGLTASERSRSLWAKLRAGMPPDWLDPLPRQAGQAFQVYRVNPAMVRSLRTMFSRYRPTSPVSRRGASPGAASG